MSISSSDNWLLKLGHKSFQLYKIFSQFNSVKEVYSVILSSQRLTIFVLDKCLNSTQKYIPCSCI